MCAACRFRAGVALCGARRGLCGFAGCAESAVYRVCVSYPARWRAGRGVRIGPDVFLSGPRKRFAHTSDCAGFAARRRCLRPRAEYGAVGLFASSPLRRGRRAGARSRPPDERGRGGGFSDAADNIRPRPTDLQDDWEVSDLHSAANRRILSEAPSAHTSDGLLHIAASCGFVRLRRGVPACRGAFRRCRGPFASRHSGFRAFSRRCFWGTPVFGGGGPCDGGCRRRFVGCARRSPSLGRMAGEGGDSGSRGRAFATTDAECEFFLKRKFCIFEKLS